jgi:adenylyltransferase/sulfurtransferase
MSIIDAPLELSVEEAKHLLDTRPAQTLLVDVREPHELAICRLPFAEHIPMRQITGQASALARDRHILVLCHHGGRSRRVTQFLRQSGLTNVSNVTGGIDAWAERIDPTLARY